ncbi:hypothetical protein [Tenacibaculum sp. 190524A02b]|uniref:hypothetical protein n=1 Tax=Tenacibaculum vairaonense TaxID=3137860 RepID=UPI0031FB67A0
MGKLFELISDNSVESLDEYYKECQVCGNSDTDLYEYQGILDRGSLEEEEEVYAACCSCIKTKPLSHICDYEYIETIDLFLNTLELDDSDRNNLKVNLIKKYNQTPDIPMFMQKTDIPLCCRDITEFIGYPKSENELIEISENYIYWEEEVKKKSEFYDFKEYGVPESLNEVASFKCKHCNKKYFTFQFS